MHVQSAAGGGTGPSSCRRVSTGVALRLTLLAGLLAALLIPLVVASRLSAHALGPRQSAPASTAVTTYKDDIGRTGQQRNETILTTKNVNVNQFGKHISYPVQGEVYAQPLYVPNVNIGGQLHNVVYIATEHDQLYAFDADATSPQAPLWSRSLINGTTQTTVPSSSVPDAVSCNNIKPEYGITGTPVIDPATGTLYVIANLLDRGVNTYRIYAIDISSGQDKNGIVSRLISASVQGSGGGNVNGTIAFQAALQMNRPGLLLLNGVVYSAWGSHCDNQITKYHGWVMGYSAVGNTAHASLAQVNVWNDTRNGSPGAGGIWEGGQGLVSDGSNIYLMSGNGKFDTRVSPAIDVGDSFVKLNLQLQLSDYFTPFNQSCLQAGDIDLGSGGPVLVPTSHELVGAGKQGRIYVVNSASMGRYTADPQLTTCGGSEETRTNVDHVLQELPNNTVGGVWGSPSYWNGPAGEFVYFAGANDHARAFKLSSGLLPSTASSQSPGSYKYPGGDVVVSSSGSTPGSGIAWDITGDGVLRAFDATDLSKEIYNTTLNAGRDGLPSYSSFSVPSVANGEVFVGTHSTLDIYGLLSSTPPTLALNSLSPASGPTGTSVTLAGSAFGSSQGSSSVSFGGASASVTSWSDSSIVATVPSGLTPGAYNVTVTVNAQASNVRPFTVTTLAVPAYNNTGTSADTNTSAANFDGRGNSYSATALQAAAITPGASVSSNGVTFTWPSAGAGQANNWLASAQVIPLSPVHGATALAFLGASTNGASSGTFTVKYTDGSTQTFNLTLSDWTLSGGTVQPSTGNQIVASLSYRNTPGGKQTHKPNVFSVSIVLTVPAGQSIASVQLPASTSPGQIHIFAVGTR